VELEVALREPGGAERRDVGADLAPFAGRRVLADRRKQRILDDVAGEARESKRSLAELEPRLEEARHGLGGALEKVVIDARFVFLVFVGEELAVEGGVEILDGVVIVDVGVPAEADAEAPRGGGRQLHVDPAADDRHAVGVAVASLDRDHPFLHRAREDPRLERVEGGRRRGGA
jgi:hypothetical protein